MIKAGSVELSSPIVAAAAAAAAGLAYANARFSLWYDATMLRCGLQSLAKAKYRQRYNRVNTFFLLQYRANHSHYRNKPFILFGAQSYTYGETYEMALRYGTWLREQRGVKRGDIVALDFMNRPQFIIWVFGLWSIGARPAFVNYNLSRDPLVHCVKAATAKLILVDPAVAANVDDISRAALPSDVVVEILTSELEAQVAATEPEPAREAELQLATLTDMAVLIYTSGTTGMPKPAVVPWAKCTAVGTSGANIVNLGEKDIFYTCMPLYHSSAFLLGLLAVLEVGATLALGARFSTKTFWKETRMHRATVIQYVGETCRYLVTAPPQIENGVNMDRRHKVRVAFGNGMRPDVWARFKERFGISTIVEFYGATEGNFATWNISNNDYALGAVGRIGALHSALNSKRLAIVKVDPDTEQLWRNTNGFCELVPPNTPGELLSKVGDGSPMERFYGYYHNGAATDAKVLRNVFREGDTWFRTGDMIRQGPDGLLYFSDRIGDTFRWKAENVSTAEVSEVVGQHEQVQEANVYGVELPHHDGRAGCVALTFVTNSEADPTDKTLQSLAAHCRRSLPRFAVPLFLRVMRDSTAHTTGTNKQQKHQLRTDGVDPAKCEHDKLFWLRGETYVRFGEREWTELGAGRVKL